MSVVKTLWASVQGDPVFMRRVNGWLAIFWIVVIPISMWRGGLNPVVYVSALSLWALVSWHWSAWQAARLEVRQHEEARPSQHRDVAGEVVDAIIDKTTIEAGERHRIDRPQTPSRSPARKDSAAALVKGCAAPLDDSPHLTAVASPAGSRR